MSFDTGLGSQSSQNSQRSFSFSDYDLLDFDQPPTCSPLSLSLPKASYPTQLILSKKTRSTNDIDSGFNFSSSSGTFTSQASLQSSQTAISNQNTILVSDDSFNSTQCQSSANSQSHEIRHEWSDSQPTENEENCDEEMPLSGVTTTAEGDENHEQSQQLNDMPDSILPEIDPILKLFSKIKTKYSDCAFVYALASNMCKDIYPKNSYISLKTALLLSIVSCNVNLNLFIMSFEFYLFL